MTQLNSLATKQFDYRWMAVHRVNKTKVPSHLWPWLITNKSLTSKLRSVGDLSVEVIEDRWGTPAYVNVVSSNSAQERLFVCAACY